MWERRGAASAKRARTDGGAGTLGFAGIASKA